MGHRPFEVVAGIVHNDDLFQRPCELLPLCRGGGICDTSTTMKTRHEDAGFQLVGKQKVIILFFLAQYKSVCLAAAMRSLDCTVKQLREDSRTGAPVRGLYRFRQRYVRLPSRNLIEESRQSTGNGIRVL